MMTQRRPSGATVKLDPDLLRKAKVTCTVEGVKLQDYVDKLVRSAIERDYLRTKRKLEQEGEQEEPG